MGDVEDDVCCWLQLGVSYEEYTACDNVIGTCEVQYMDQMLNEKLVQSDEFHDNDSGKGRNELTASTTELEGSGNVTMYLMISDVEDVNYSVHSQ